MEITAQQVSSLSRLLARMHREFGATTLKNSEEMLWAHLVDCVPSGIPELQQAMGLPGLPRGHIVELVGPEQCGKSTLALRILAGAQAMGCTAALLDCSQQLDVHTAFALGVQGEDLIFSHPTGAEQAFGITEMLVASGAVDLVVVDAVSALIPFRELSAPINGLSSPGTALVLLRALQRIGPKIRRSRCCLLFLDQLRDRDQFPFGIPETNLNTRTLSPFTAIRLSLRAIHNGMSLHADSRGASMLSVPKNRLGPVGRSCEIPWVALPG